MKRLAIVTLSLVTALTSVPPAMAFPTVAVPKIEVRKAQPVQYSYYGPTYYRPRYYAPRYNRQVYYGGKAHTGWCYARYRSYRAYDNTFQPFYGPRRACVSPY